ncbi:MAG: transporter substrate-binding domain-containing protein [Burkholderiales bacterium]
MQPKSFVAVLMSILLGAANAAQAQSPAGTLGKIRDTGEIRLGHRDVSIPFSYLDDRQVPVGFAMDLCDRIVDAVKTELKLASVRVTLQPIQLSNQIPLIQNGTIDLVCGPATNTLERQKVVAFSNTIFVSSIRAVVRKDSPVRSFEDLGGKTVSLTAGSTSIGLLTAREQDRKFATVKLQNPDHAASFLSFSTGRAEAFVMDDILLASLVANSATPGAFRLIDDALRVEPYGLILRKDDAPFKELVDRTLVTMMRNGEFQRLYDRWFLSPIPPKNVNLNFPMTPPLKEAIANPNDRGV